MRKMFVFIAFSVLMLLSAAVFACDGGDVTNDDCDSVASVETTAVVSPMSDGKQVVVVVQHIAGLSVNRFCNYENEISAQYVFVKIEPLYPLRMNIAENTSVDKRTWTRVIWTI